MEDIKKYGEFLNEEIDIDDPTHGADKEYAVRIKGFKSKEEAQSFVDWYSKSGGYGKGGFIVDIIYVD